MFRFSALFLFFSSISFAQADLLPSKTHALMYVMFLHPDQSPYQNSEVILRGVNSKIDIKGQTDSNGSVKLLVPVGDRYTSSCGIYINEAPIAIPNRPNIQWKGKRFTHPAIKFIFEYKDLFGSVVNDEQIRVATKSGLVFVAETNVAGIATMYLPGEDFYRISTASQEDFHEFNCTIPMHGITTFKYFHIAISSLQLEQEALQRIADQKAAEAAHIEYQKEMHSLDSIRACTPTVVIFINRYGKPIDIYDGGKTEALTGQITDYFYSICRNRPNEKTAEVLVRKLRGTYHYYARSEDQEWSGTYTLYGGGVHYVSVGLEEGKRIDQ